MPYRVEITERALRDFQRIYLTVNASDSTQARAWFNGFEAAILSLDEYPARGAAIPEGGELRHLLYGRKRHRYRIIYEVDEQRCVVTVLHIRHGARNVLPADNEAT